MPTPLSICSGPHPALPLRPNYMLPPLRCPLGSLLTLLPFPGSMSPPVPLCWADATSSLLSSWTLVGVEGTCAQKSTPLTSASPLVPCRFSTHHHLPPAVPVTPTSGEGAARSVCCLGWGFACEYKYICTPWAFRLPPHSLAGPSHLGLRQVNAEWLDLHACVFLGRESAGGV